MIFRILFLLCLLSLLPASATEATVTTQALLEVLIEKKYTIPAEVVAVNKSQISAEISARIHHIAVQVGDVIDAGGVLAQLDCQSYQNALGRAEAVLESLQAQAQLAKQRLDRAQSVQIAGGMTADAQDQYSANLTIAEAKVREQLVSVADAKLSITRCAILAPYRATISKRLVGTGQLAMPGLPLFEIVGLDAVELSAQVPTTLSAALQQAKSLRFVTHDNTLTATIRSQLPVINLTSGSREIRLLLDQVLEPGTSGRLEWYAPPQLPASLLTQRQGKLGVFIAKTRNDTTVAEFIALDHALEGRPTAIDLPAETQIIIKGRQQLFEDAAINIVNKP